MTVDLHKNPGDPDGGVVTFRNGDVFFSLSVGQDEDGDYVVRFESGYYPGYTRDGLRCRLVSDSSGKSGKRWIRQSDQTEGPWDVVAFDRCDNAPAGVQVNHSP